MVISTRPNRQHYFISFVRTKFIWLLAGVLLTASGHAGAASLAPDSTEVPHRHFTAALRYGSNSAYFGRTQATAFPYLATNLTYETKGGLFADVSLYNLLNTPRLLDETDLSVGWNGDLSKTLDASVSYSRFVFPVGSELVKSSVNNSLDAALGQDWGPFYSRLSAAYLFSKSTSSADGFLTLENSRTIEIPHIFSADDYFIVEPTVSVAAGTQSFVEASLTRRRGARVRSTRHFSLVDYEFAVPLTYTLGKVALEAGWRYIVPVNLPADDVDSHALSVWTAGVTFTL